MSRQKLPTTICAMPTVIHEQMRDFFEEEDIRVQSYIFIGRAVYRYIQDLKAARGK